MTISADNFKTSAIDYISSLNGITNHQSVRIIDALLNSISSYNINELPKQDFELIVNQFFNLVYFGPVTNLELYITEDCNLACDYCFVRDKNHKMMPLNTIYSAINFLMFYSGNQKNLNITLFGGEPLMEKETIYKVVDYIRKIERESVTKKINISVTTNGTLLSDEFLKRTHDKINFLLSIDGDEKTHDFFRKYKNGKGTFKTVVSKIRIAKCQPSSLLYAQNSGIISSEVQGFN